MKEFLLGYHEKMALLLAKSLRYARAFYHMPHHIANSDEVEIVDITVEDEFTLVVFNHTWTHKDSDTDRIYVPNAFYWAEH